MYVSKMLFPRKSHPRDPFLFTKKLMRKELVLSPPRSHKNCCSTLCIVKPIGCKIGIPGIHDLELLSVSHTVGGRNPAPVDMVNIPFLTGSYTSQVVQDFFHQQYHQKFQVPKIEVLNLRRAILRVGDSLA